MHPESQNKLNKLNKLTQEAYDAWQAIEPPTNFAASVVAAVSREEALLPHSESNLPSDPPSRGSLWGARGLVVGAAVASIVVAVSIAMFSRTTPEFEPMPESTTSWINGGTPNIGPELRTIDTHEDFIALPLPADLSERVDDYIASHGRLYGDVFRFHGTIIVARGGDLVVRRSYGDAIRSDRGEAVPHRPDTRFRIGTLTQQITATAVMMLVDRGTIGLDESLHTYLPDYPEVGRGITIRQLLGHTSGIPSFTDDLSHEDWRAKPHTTETLLARFSSAPLEFEPGTEFDPSNSGYAVLGAVIEAVTGMSYGEFVEREIFAPLGMERSSIGEPPEGTRQASGYLFSEEEQLLPFDRANFDLRAFGAAGNIVSTADDLSRFARALFEGRLLKDETLETMLAPANKDGYALGWIREREFGQDVVGHPGGSEGINAAIRYYRGDHTLIIAIANNDVIDCRSVAEQLGQITHGRSPMRPMERHEVAVDPARFKVYSGRYVLTQESRAELNRFFDPAEVERLAEAHVGPDRSKQRLYFFVPGHGSKVMHGLDRDTFFFKDAAATVATFDFRQRVGAGAGGGGIPEDAGVPKDPPASALHLRQGPLEIHFVRAPEHPSEPAP